MTRPSKSFDTKFWRQVDRDPEDLFTCWLWTGGKIPDGYGCAWRRAGAWGGSPSTQDMMLAHRAAWELTFKTPIPNGMQVLHRCDEPSCVNPAHLFLGTQEQNMEDMRRKGRRRFVTTWERWLGENAYCTGPAVVTP